MNFTGFLRALHALRELRVKNYVFLDDKLVSTQRVSTVARKG